MSYLDRIPQNDSLNRFIGFSIAAHVFILLIFTVKAFFSTPIAYESAVRVDLIGLPDKVQPQDLAPSPPVAKEETSAPTPAPTAAAEPEAVKPPLPTKKPKEVDAEAINLNKTKSKQAEALTKLKQMSAFEKIQEDLEKENRRQATLNAAKQIKGNQISSGSQLTGLAKLQAENYIGEVEKKIRQNWVLPQWLARKNLSAQVRVRFDERGHLIAAQIVKSSGNPAFDEIVIETVQKSSPVAPPPEKFVRLFNLEGILFGFPE